jgi:uncharacterized LabA/DUF88 family protein
VPRLCVFIDYQNTYKGAREAFHPYNAPLTDGQIDPLRLGEVLADKDINDPELLEVRVYRGRPDSLKDPRGYGANLRQCTAWENSSPRVKVIWRTLRYPANWPEEDPEEKGIDVALAIDVVVMAVRGEYDIGVVMSTDTDIKPALEAVAEISGNPFPRVAVAAWSAEDRHSRRLSISGRRLWCHWLGRNDYEVCADPTYYGSPQRQDN